MDIREAAQTTEEGTETSFLRVWKARESDKSAQEVAEYLGCGCTLNTTAL